MPSAFDPDVCEREGYVAHSIKAESISLYSIMNDREGDYELTLFTCIPDSDYIIDEVESRVGAEVGRLSRQVEATTGLLFLIVIAQIIIIAAMLSQRYRSKR
jgi:hypothetical protein